MAHHKSAATFEKMLLKFMCEPDPMLAMLEWLCHQMVEAEVSSKLDAQKGEHSEKRTGHRCGTRARRFDTRMGTIYLLVPEVRKEAIYPSL